MDNIAECTDLGNIKLILTDFDYTFLDSKHNVPESNARAFGEISAAGIIPAIASGRSREGTLSCLTPACRELMKYNGFPGVFLNGGVVYGQDGEVLCSTNIPVASHKLLMEKMKEMGILKNILGYTADRIYCIEKNEFTRKNCIIYKEPEPVELSMEEFASTPFVKLVACGTVESTNKVRPVLEKALGGCLRCVQPLDWNVELVDSTVSKAVGADVLLRHLGLTPRQLLAVGDGENDIQLLRFAGVSVAVANACAAAKEAADYITVNNDECAFLAIADLVLKAHRGQGNKASF